MKMSRAGLQRIWAVHGASLVFVLGLALSAAVALSLDGGLRKLALATTGGIDYAAPTRLAPQPPRPLTEAERRAARVAWDYFEANTRPGTGFVDSVEGFPSSTLWDQGSYLLALVAAHRLGLVADGEFETRARRFLESLGRLPLHQGMLPNKAYDTRSLAMVDYDNTPRPEGIGWSALDIGRMLAGLRVLEGDAPELVPQIRAVLAGWRLEAMAEAGELMGAGRDEGPAARRQEGRLGYEQYAARSAAMWGLDVTRAASPERVLDWIRVEGVEVPVDLRTAGLYGASTPVTSEPFLLTAFEFGLDDAGEHLAEPVYLAQERRWRRSGTLTAVSEDHLDRPPRFAYAAIFANGRKWNVVDETGRSWTELRWLSTKAAFGWHALYGTDYTARLVEAVAPLAVPGKGWQAGIYEADGAINTALALNTNAVILEAIHYIARGPLWSLR